jgi:Pyruvate/2-oxoacid:ferredoxin oxidoreductase delta subunit
MGSPWEKLPTRIQWIRPSTRAFFQEWRAQDHSKLSELIHGYVYAVYPYLYISIGTGEHPLSNVFRFIGRIRKWLRFQNGANQKPTPTFAEGYHGKVVPTDAARQLVSVQEDIELGDLEQIIPYDKARDIIFKNPDHIVLLQCPCRSAREDPCLPLDVCLIIGEPFSSLVLEHHAGRARWISQDEAAEILFEENQRGHTHHAFFKDAMLGRFYAICNCCECCCGAIQSFRNGTPMLTSSGFMMNVDEELCQDCGLCLEVCPFSAIDHSNGSVAVIEARCMGCGVCVTACDLDALSLVREPRKGIPLEVSELIKDRKISSSE